MSNKYKVGDRVVCVKPKSPEGYGTGSKGTVVRHKDDVRVKWDDSGIESLAYAHEIELIKEKEMEKTCTVTLTELEAKVFTAVALSMASYTEGSIGKVFRGILVKISNRPPHIMFMGNNGEVAAAIGAIAKLPHGQSVTAPPVVLSLNPSYKAEVSKDGVRVDGTLYSWDVVQALKDAVGKIVASATGAWMKVHSTKELQTAMADGQEVYYTSSICNPDYNGVWIRVFASNLDNLPFNGTYRTRKFPESVSIPVGQYTAVVTKDGIKVGCQTFPTSIADTLLANKPQ